MPKLLMVVDDFVGGGAFKVGERLAYGLESFYRVAFACNLSSLNRAARRGLSEVGVEVIGLFAHAGETMRARYDRGGACALLRRASPDMILFVDSSPRSNLATKDVARDAGVPYASIVNFVDRETPAALKVFDVDVERAANAAEVNVFVSAAARAEFEANFPRVSAPRLVIGNGVPDEFFAPVALQACRALRSELGLGDDDVMLLLAGRLEPRKGQHLALAALAALAARDGPRVKLFLAGFGEAVDRWALVERIRALKLEHCVRYLGMRDDLPLLLDACDIVLMPSEQEADPLASKEAMARGRPVVASDLPGVREQGHPEALRIPAPGQTPERTIEVLAAVIDALRRDPARRAEIGRSLRNTAKRRFTMAQMIGAYREVLEALPERRPVRAAPAPALHLGRWLDFAQTDEAAGLFKDGWSELERDGVWSIGTRSRIAFALPRPARNVAITLKVSAFAGRGRERTFEVFANARKVADWTFSGPRVAQRTIRLMLPTPKRIFVLRLHHAEPSSPYQLGLNDDRRPLGLYVRALRINADVSLAGRFGPLWRALRR